MGRRADAPGAVKVQVVEAVRTDEIPVHRLFKPRRRHWVGVRPRRRREERRGDRGRRWLGIAAPFPCLDVGRIVEDLPVELRRRFLPKLQ